MSCQMYSFLTAQEEQLKVYLIPKKKQQIGENLLFCTSVTFSSWYNYASNLCLKIIDNCCDINIKHY